MAESWRYLGSSRCASRLPILTAGNPSAPSGFQRPGVCNRSERSGHTTRGRCERFRVQDYLRELGDWPPRDASGTRPARCVSCDLVFLCSAPVHEVLPYKHKARLTFGHRLRALFCAHRTVVDKGGGKRLLRVPHPIGYPSSSSLNVAPVHLLTPIRLRANTGE